MKYILRCRLCGLVYEEDDIVVVTGESGSVAFSAHSNEYYIATHDCEDEWSGWEGIADVVGRKHK